MSRSDHKQREPYEGRRCLWSPCSGVRDAWYDTSLGQAIFGEELDALRLLYRSQARTSMDPILALLRVPPWLWFRGRHPPPVAQRWLLDCVRRMQPLVAWGFPRCRVATQGVLSKSCRVIESPHRQSIWWLR